MSQNNKLDTQKKDFLNTNSFLPAYHNNQLNKVVLTPDRKQLHGNIEIKGEATTAIYKMFDMSIMYLTCDDATKRIIKTEDGHIVVDPVILIPLFEYGKLNGYKLEAEHFDDAEQQRIENIRAIEARKTFKKKIKKILDNMLNINYRYDSPELFDTGYLIGRASIVKGYQKTLSDDDNIKNNLNKKSNTDNTEYIRIEFVSSIAETILRSPKVQRPLMLYKLDDRNPNAYAIGRAISIHASMDKNIQKDTANTLKVKTLLSKAPDIISIKELEKQGQRKWKDRIKNELEHALNELVKVGFLIQWFYRNSETDELLTFEEVNSFSYKNFENLFVNYELTENSYMQNRLACESD